MNKRWRSIPAVACLVVTSVLVLPTQDILAESKNDVTIGIVHDGLARHPDVFFGDLENELTALLGSRYNVQLPPDRILDAEWSAENATAYYARLMEDRQVDIVLGFGPLAGTVIAKAQVYPKPVIIVGILDPELQSIRLVGKNISNVHNLTYLLFNRSIARDLKTFYRVYPYKKVGIVFHGSLLDLIPLENDNLRNVMAETGSEFVPLPVREGIEDVLSSLDGVDAIYLGYLEQFEGDEKVHLIDELNARGIPTFGFSRRDVNQGALAGTMPEENLPKIWRRIALNVESILEGEDAADLPVTFSFEQKIAINMETARKIGFSPKFTILSEAELINRYVVPTDRVLSLVDVMREAMTASLELEIEAAGVRSAEKDVSLARTNLLPSLTLGAAGVKIGEEQAAGSMGQQAERTISAAATVEQVVFSERAIGNVAIQKHLRLASEYGYGQVKLNVILNAATAYFDVLSAQTALKIQEDNIRLTERNLEVSKQREAVGHSGPSDVYRWESSLATATTNLLAAEQNVTLAKIQLNQLLNRPLDEAFIVQEATLTDSVYLSYLTAAREFVDNPRSLEIYTNFLIAETLHNSPEIQELDASIAALERSLTSYRLRPFLPSIGLGAEARRIADRSGAGSDVPGTDPVDDTWNVSIVASLPLFEGGSNRVNAQQTKINIDQLKSRREQLAQVVELNLRAAILQTSVKVVNLESSQRSADFAGRSLELVQDAYSRGSVSIVELIDAQNAALNAESAELNSVYELLTSLLKTERAVGRFTLLGSPEEREDFRRRSRAYFDEHVE